MSLCVFDVIRSGGVSMTLKEYRERLGLTQKDVAQQAGIISEYYSQIERGRISLPNTELRRAISRVLGIRHVDFLVAAGILDDWEVPGFSATAPASDPLQEEVALYLRQLDLDADNRAATLLGILRMWAQQDRQRSDMLMFSGRNEIPG
jgi:transcriptional regulator with XRE-family HTH domain